MDRSLLNGCSGLVLGRLQVRLGVSTYLTLEAVHDTLAEIDTFVEGGELVLDHTP